MKRPFAAFTAALLATSCIGGGGTVADYVPREVDQYSRHFLDLLARGEIDSAEWKFDRQIPHDTARKVLIWISDSLKGVPLDSAEIIGTHWTTSGSDSGEVTQREVVYLVPVRGRWMKIEFDLRDVSAVRELIGFHFNMVMADPRVVGRFTMDGKGVGYYLFFLIVAACAGTAIATSVWVIRQRGFPRRWLWGFVALVGAGTVTVDWTNGDVSQKLLSAILFCFGAVRGGPGDHWYLSVAFPAGAFVAIARVQAWHKKRSEAIEIPSTASVPAILNTEPAADPTPPP